MWDPRRGTTQRTSMACYRDSFTLVSTTHSLTIQSFLVFSISSWHVCEENGTFMKSIYPWWPERAILSSPVIISHPLTWGRKQNFGIFVLFGMPKTMDKVHRECYTPSPEPVRIFRLVSISSPRLILLLYIFSVYGLNGRRVGVRIPVGSRIFTSRYRPDRLWGPPSLLHNRYRDLFLRGGGGKAAGAWSWQITNKCWRPENVYPYIHSPIHFHGIVFS
jgi:hypothetical protein